MPHKVQALNNVDLSQYFWVDWLERRHAQGPDRQRHWQRVLLHPVPRSRRASSLVLAYFMLLPPIMAATMFRKFFVRMGFIRYMLMANLLLFMMSLPIKMVLRWTVNLKYIVSIPEYFLNF